MFPRDQPGAWKIIVSSWQDGRRTRCSLRIVPDRTATAQLGTLCSWPALKDRRRSWRAARPAGATTASLSRRSRTLIDLHTRSRRGRLHHPKRDDVGRGREAALIERLGRAPDERNRILIRYRQLHPPRKDRDDTIVSESARKPRHVVSRGADSPVEVVHACAGTTRSVTRPLPNSIMPASRSRSSGCRTVRWSGARPEPPRYSVGASRRRLAHRATHSRAA
jgi:hypothetical protein